jgi:putative flippase GtrA
MAAVHDRAFACAFVVGFCVHFFHSDVWVFPSSSVHHFLCGRTASFLCLTQREPSGKIDFDDGSDKICL